MSDQILYTIAAPRPSSHRFHVAIDIARPHQSGQRLTLPAWIPGSYLVRNFARHVGRVTASDTRGNVAVSKVDNSTWRCAPADGPLRVEYDVFAWDPSVRGAHLDATHGFFNGANVFMAVSGQEREPVDVALLAPPVAGKPWRVATTLARRDAPQWGFGLYGAASYDELIDHPVEMGHFDLVDFDAAGVPHRVVLSGRHFCDGPRLARDLARICEQHVSLFGELPPMDQYLFLTRVVGEGYGGLEHRSSTALMCKRSDLPGRADEVTKDYRRFLGLASHEYFHLWNIKRIKPAAFTPFELDRESHTRLLWVFEGITSYYDDLALVRSGVIDTPGYLELVSEIIGRVLSVSGHRWQSLAESSFDAWTKFYQPNEDTPNSVVSYYAKGALVALLLDLTIRDRTADRIGLDDVMRQMWTHYGKPGHGVPEDGFEVMCETVTGLDLGPFFDRYIRSTADLDLERALKTVGISMTSDITPSPAVALGLKFRNDTTEIATVWRDGAAESGGLAPGDVLVAVDALRVTPGNWETLVAPYAPGDQATVHVFRGDELRALEVTFEAPPSRRWRLLVDEEADPAATARRARWLHDEIVAD